MMRTIAIDWSGDAKHAAEKIWTASVESGELTELRNGRDSDEILEFLVQQAAIDSDVVVGLDFAFSFPAWFVGAHGSAPELWKVVAQDSFIDWRKEVEPFFGTTNSTYRGSGDALRSTDHAMASKSVFKVSGIGSVGTGSMRGMPLLAKLHEAGFGIWPFMPPHYPLVLEIYPRACLDTEVTRTISARFSKTNPLHRRKYLSRIMSGVWLDLACSSEDSFDAATSALAMWTCRDDLRSLPDIAHDVVRKEGIIWSPSWREQHAECLSGLD